MRTKLSVSLNGTQLYNVDSSIIIQGIDEQTLNMNPTAASHAGLNGQHFISLEKRYRDVVISFAINERDFTKRRKIFGKVCTWARDGGQLRVGYRSTDHVLNVVCTALPALANVSQWTNPLQITFRAYDIPYWIDNIGIGQAPSESSTDTSFVVENPGTMPTKLEIMFTNNSGSTCNSVTITSGSQKIRLTSLGLASGETLFINYNSKDIQSMYIRNGSANRSVMAKRTTDSNDDIWMPVGNYRARVQSDVVLDLNFFARGRYD